MSNATNELMKICQNLTFLATDGMKMITVTHGINIAYLFYKKYKTIPVNCILFIILHLTTQLFIYRNKTLTVNCISSSSSSLLILLLLLLLFFFYFFLFLQQRLYRKEGKKCFILRLYGVGHMIKDLSDR